MGKEIEKALQDHLDWLTKQLDFKDQQIAAQNKHLFDILNILNIMANKQNK